MKATLSLPTKYEWGNREWGPGEVEFDLMDEVERSAHEVLSRVVATATEPQTRVPKSDRPRGGARSPRRTTPKKGAEGGDQGGA